MPLLQAIHVFNMKDNDLLNEINKSGLIKA